MFFPERRAHVVLCQSVIVTDRRDEKKKKEGNAGAPGLGVGVCDDRWMKGRGAGAPPYEGREASISASACVCMRSTTKKKPP